jgi:protein-tyrosine phosphatase
MRGAQPSDAGYAALKRAGVDTVINLRPEAPWADAMAERQGLRAIDLPLPAIGAPTPAQAMAFLKLVTDPANGRVYFNCQRGIDRTGAMAAAYRIAAQGWTLDQAAAEMRQFGFKEGVESDKLAFLRQFDAYWRALPADAQNAALHRA